MIGALLTSLAVGQAGPPEPVETRAKTVFVSWDAQAKSCVPQIDGVETGPVSTDEGKAALIAALRDKGAFIKLIGKNGYVIPYDCAADIATALKHAGFYGRIGFISEPPAPAPASQ